MQSFTCRRAAVFSDIHSNYPAFKACCDDALDRGADLFIFLGDYISDLAEPCTTMDLVYELRSRFPCICLRGNRERYMLEYEQGVGKFARGSKTGSLLYTYENLRHCDLDFYRKLPIYDLIEVNGVPIEIAHSLKNDDHFYYEKEDESIQSVFEQIEQPYFLTGHSHRQYAKTNECKTIINPGSIGVPHGNGYHAQYALLDVGSGRFDVCFRRVSYCIEDSIRAQFRSGLTEYANYWAISILYDIITGKEHTLHLLERVQRKAARDSTAIYDENLWRCAAEEMGMRFTQREILAYLQSVRDSQ